MKGCMVWKEGEILGSKACAVSWRMSRDGAEIKIKMHRIKAYVLRSRLHSRHGGVLRLKSEGHMSCMDRRRVKCGASAFFCMPGVVYGLDCCTPSVRRCQTCRARRSNAATGRRGLAAHDVLHDKYPTPHTAQTSRGDAGISHRLGVGDAHAGQAVEHCSQ